MRTALLRVKEVECFLQLLLLFLAQSTLGRRGRGHRSRAAQRRGRAGCQRRPARHLCQCSSAAALPSRAKRLVRFASCGHRWLSRACRRLLCARRRAPVTENRERPFASPRTSSSSSGVDSEVESRPASTDFESLLLYAREYKYGFKLLYEITVVRVPVKVRKTRSLKLGPAAARP